MKKSFKKLFAALIMCTMLCTVGITAFAANDTKEVVETIVDTDAVSEVSAEDNTTSAKAIAAAITVGLAAAAGAIGMGMAVTKSVDAISRQPEAEGKIRTTLMLGLVFVETAIIYALVIAILIIFVL